MREGLAGSLIEQVNVRTDLHRTVHRTADVVFPPKMNVNLQVPQYSINHLDDGINEKISLVVQLPGES